MDKDFISNNVEKYIMLIGDNKFRFYKKFLDEDGEGVIFLFENNEKIRFRNSEVSYG